MATINKYASVICLCPYNPPVQLASTSAKPKSRFTNPCRAWLKLRYSSSAASMALILAAAEPENNGCITTRTNALCVNAQVTQPPSAWALNQASMRECVHARASTAQSARWHPACAAWAQSSRIFQQRFDLALSADGRVSRQVKHPHSASLLERHFFNTAAAYQFRHGLPKVDGAGFGVGLRGAKSVIFSSQGGARFMLHWLSDVTLATLHQTGKGTRFTGCNICYYFNSCLRPIYEGRRPKIYSSLIIQLLIKNGLPDAKDSKVSRKTRKSDQNFCFCIHFVSFASGRPVLARQKVSC